MANIRVGLSVVATLKTVGLGNPASSRNPRARDEPFLRVSGCQRDIRTKTV
jgi:hypothetical protein